MQNKRYFLICFILILSFFSVSAWQHERVHQEVFRQSGVDSVIVLSLETGQLLTVPLENYDSEETARFARLGHNVNEVVAYNLFPMFIMLGLLNVLGFIYVRSGLK